MKLNAAFGAGYKIYQNDVEQGFKEPCFFIAVLKPDISPLQKNRFMNRNPLDVHYFPTSGRNNAELFAMAGDLMECLEFITLPNGDVLHGTSMSYEVQDGVLHFFVNYNLTLRRETEETAMETLETTVEPKKGDSMATRKKAATAQEPTITAPVVFPKERVLTFRRYADRRDLLSVLLEDGKEYTFDQIDGLINDFMKGKVK